MIFEQITKDSHASIEKEDLDKALRIVQPYKPKVILEIGMWKGYSAENWLKAFVPEIFISLERDHKHEDGIYHNDPKDPPAYDYLWDVDSNSQETVAKVKELLKGREIDFMFIDGGHKFDTVYTDWLNYSPLVKEGGIIAFHDILYTSFECQAKLLWEILKQTYDYVEINCGAGSTGFGIIFNHQPMKATQGLHQ